MVTAAPLSNPEPVPVGAGERLTCALCGHRFPVAAGVTGCAGCPLHHGCGALCCPRCGYGLVRESPMLSRLRRWLGRLRGASN